MTARRHEIPTHLNVEDRAFYGLSARQITYLTVGSTLSYGLWNQASDLPFALRIALAVMCLGIASALALVRPNGRGLEEWAFVALRYVAVPRASVWRPGEPDVTSWRPGPEDWQELTPRVAWTAEPSDSGVDPKGARS
jgi:PrgI family protein